MQQNNESMTYSMKRTLERRDAIDPIEPADVEGVLLVGNRMVLEYEDEHTQYGCDVVQIRPAIHNGKRVWVARYIRSAAYGYSASGTYEEILEFEAGAALLAERECFTFATEDESILHYAQWTELKWGNKFRQRASIPMIDTILLVAHDDIPGLDWEVSGEGFPSVMTILPAIWGEQRVWVKRQMWRGGDATSPTVNEELISFQAGVALLIQRGLFSFPTKSAFAVSEEAEG